MKTVITLFATAVFLSNCATAKQEAEWISLFNGRDLDGWVVKINNLTAGKDPGSIFRVEDGLLTVSYDAFDEFGERFGHIFINRPFTNYHFRCEYRFTGEQVKGGPAWAFRNNGAMLHCQSPESMKIDQKFPDSLEFQFLGAYDDGKPRVTGSVCTPGTYVDVNGKTITKHVIESSCPARPADEWVLAEAIVKDGKVQHLINGDVVLEYTNLFHDDGTPVTFGHIALQAESHPTQFRKIEILELH